MKQNQSLPFASLTDAQLQQLNDTQQAINSEAADGNEVILLAYQKS